MGGLSKCLVIYFGLPSPPLSPDTRATPVGGKCQENDAKVTGGGGYMIANNGWVFFAGTRLRRENSAYGTVPARDLPRRAQ